jgi:hypothetical protein
MLKRKTVSKASADSWTVMVYMVADDDDGVFTNEHVKKEVAAIRAAVKRHPGAQIAVHADLRDAAITRHFVEKGELVDKPTDQTAPGSVETIRNFIAFGMETHPAEHYLFIFWGHGFGPAGLKYGRFVLPTELRKALRKGFGMLSPPIDIVTLMSCQMNTIELAYEFSQWPLLPFTKVTNHIVASQGSVKPEEPFPYEEMFSALSRDGKDPAAIGTRVVDSLNTKNGVRNGERFAAPFSLVDVGSSKKVADALKALAPDIVATKPFNANHSKFGPLQHAMHDAMEEALTHDLSLLDLGRLGRGFGELAVKTKLSPSEASVLARLRTAGSQLSTAVEKAFVLHRLTNADHKTTGASVFCPTHHNPDSKGAGAAAMAAVPNVEVAVAEDMMAYRRSWFATHTNWSDVVDQARDTRS